MPDMGPEGVVAEDERLLELLRQREELGSLPEWRKPPASGRAELVDALLPLVISQGLDLLSTEKPFGFLQYEGTREANPLPGMSAPGGAGTAARIGYGGLEALLAALLLKRAPSLGKAYVAASTGVHHALTRGNQDLMDSMQTRVREPGR